MSQLILQYQVCLLIFHGHCFENLRTGEESLPLDLFPATEGNINNARFPEQFKGQHLISHTCQEAKWFIGEASHLDECKIRFEEPITFGSEVLHILCLSQGEPINTLLPLQILQNQSQEIIQKCIIIKSRREERGPEKN